MLSLRRPFLIPDSLRYLASKERSSRNLVCLVGSADRASRRESVEGGDLTVRGVGRQTEGSTEHVFSERLHFFFSFQVQREFGAGAEKAAV